MRTQIKIDTDPKKKEIGHIFGYANTDDYVADLQQREDRYGERLRFLSFFFMEFIDPNKEKMYMSYVMSQILTGVAREELDSPAKVLDYINRSLDDEHLEMAALGCAQADMHFFGKESKTLKELMEDADAKKGK